VSAAGGQIIEQTTYEERVAHHRGARLGLAVGLVLIFWGFGLLLLSPNGHVTAHERIRFVAALRAGASCRRQAEDATHAVVATNPSACDDSNSCRSRRPVTLPTTALSWLQVGGSVTLAFLW
jgi:hypothetical protein